MASSGIQHLQEILCCELDAIELQNRRLTDMLEIGRQYEDQHHSVMIGLYAKLRKHNSRDLGEEHEAVVKGK